MEKIKVIVIAVVVFLFCILIGVLWYMKQSEISDATQEEFLEMEVTADNFSECAAELLLVGGKLFYIDHIEDGYCYVTGYFAKSRIKNTFADLELTKTDWDTFNNAYGKNYTMREDNRYFFLNDIGAIQLAELDGSTYLCFEIYDPGLDFGYFDRSTHRAFCFVTEEDLSEKLKKAEKHLHSTGKPADPYMN